MARVLAERLGEERGGELGGLVEGVLPRPDRDDLGVVVLAGQLRGLEFQASAARMPGTLLAAICSPLPEPPMTMPRLPGSASTARPVAMQYGG